MRKILAVVFIVALAILNGGYAFATQGFDYQSYLAFNSDLPQTWSKAECMEHFRLFGFSENRAVSFSLAEYLYANPDLPKSWTFEEALAHYNIFGRYENRLLAFHAQEYLSLYPDLPQDWTYEQAWAHYIYFGKQEGRIASFDETAYLELYPDLPQSWNQTEAFYHYLLYGRYEGRAYDPYDESVFIYNCDGTVDEGCMSKYPLRMAAAGDSITVAYNAEGDPLIVGNTDEQYEVSWALGDSEKINSHAQRLRALEDGFSWDAELDNYAIAGANIADLHSQINNIVENGPYDYVVIFIGHNDICDASTASEMLSTAAFRESFISAMDVLYDQEPPSDVIVSSLANVSNLYDAGKDDNWCNGNAFLGLSIWEWGNVCPVVTSGNPVDISAADIRTQEYNAVLEDLSSEYGYKYVPEIYEAEFTLDDLSDFDCFHPNVQGQNKISEIIWNNGLYSQ